MKKNYIRNSFIITLLFLIFLYLINSNLIIKSILDYTKLFINKLFPTNFLFFILSSLLIDLGIINLLNSLKLNGSILFVTIMSIISGLPSGAKYTKDLLNKKLITNKTANYLIMFTNFPNPLFILGSVNSILNNYHLSLKILISLIISNIIIAIIFYPHEKKKLIDQPTNKFNLSQSLSKATIEAIKVLVIIYGSSIFFFLITIIINKYLNLNPILYILINGFFDLTKGIFSTAIITNELLKSIFIIFFISFGSLSIHIQIKSIISNTFINYKNYLYGRVLQTIIAIPIFMIIY